MTSLTAHYVVSTVHDGTDWCVRPATPEEIADAEREPEEEWTMSLADAREVAAATALEFGCKWFDFSEEVEA